MILLDFFQKNRLGKRAFAQIYLLDYSIFFLNFLRKQGKVNVISKNKKFGEKPKKESYPHFRYYKPSRHPALIIGEQKSDKNDEYRYRKVMHSEYDGRHLNEKVYPNPNPKDKKPMYIGNRIRHDEKTKFEEKPLPWKYPNKKIKK